MTGAAAVDHMMPERQNVTDYINSLFNQRKELQQEVQAKIAEWQELILKDNFDVVSLAPQTDCRANRPCASEVDCLRLMSKILMETFCEQSVLFKRSFFGQECGECHS